ncbi:hypothetical protein F5Y19DRAFT_433818 [Xylariaceae sp. FL1651]|nr:hypothetical protein F5Y19DRAFT_433818 [Xylariaceae sp. FL1651]
MSITLTISRSGLKLSRHRAAVECDKIENGKPDIASLDNFASKVRFFQKHQDKATETARTQPTGEALEGNAKPEQQSITSKGEASPLETGVQLAGSPSLDRPPEGSLALKVDESTLQSPQSQLTGTVPLLSSVNSDSTNAINEEATANNTTLSLRSPSGTATTATSSTAGAESAHTELTKPDSAQGDDIGEYSGAQDNTIEDRMKSRTTVGHGAIQTSKLASRSSSISSKGKEAVQSLRWKPTKIHIPRSKLDILRKIKIASPETIKIEDAVFSAVYREKLRKFSGILGSKKDQIELFGKELPLCRAFLVQVTEEKARPAAYICIQGLKNAADITRIHSAMSHKRYKALYDPLRLCYETSDISHIGNPESAETPQSSSHNKLRIRASFPSGSLSPIPKPEEFSVFGLSLQPDSDKQTFYEYLPIVNERTYCGALSRTFVNGKTYLSTFGGLVEVDGMTCLMTCQHNSSEPSNSITPSLSDTLVENDVLSTVEGPLVFCSGDLCDGPTGLDQANQFNVETRHVALDTSRESDWKILRVGGAIRKGREWCLVPVEDQFILPNFVERPNSKKGKGTDEPEILYLDQIAEPEPGHATYIPRARYSGVVSTNTSFIFGGGTDGVLEVWSVIIDGEQGLQKGDSGSWVLDTSDPLQYKVIGSVIAISDGIAHFVRLQDQFFEMTGDAIGSSRASIAPAFRALVQCAHMAYKRNDFHSADWFIKQALSRRVLEQMHNGWYLPTIKTLLGIIDSDGNLTPGGKTSPPSIAESLADLLLAYGIELLDATLFDRDFDLESLKKYHSGLNASEKRILRELAVAWYFYEDKPKRSNKPPEPLPKGDSGMTKERLAAPQMSKHADGVCAAPARASQSNDRRIFGFQIDKKVTTISPIPIFLALSKVGFAGLSGIAAMMILRDAERGNRNSIFHVGTSKAVSIGGISGMISVIPLAIQTLLIFIHLNFNWCLYLGGNVFPPSTRHRRICGIAWSAISRFIGIIILIIASSFARSTLTVLYLARSLNVVDTHPLVVASTAAAAPMIVSTALPSVLFYTSSKEKVIRKLGWDVLLSLTAGAGFDSLAGYTFGKVAQDQGLDIIKPASGAASFGVFGALTVLWPFIFTLCWYRWILYRMRKQKNSVSEPDAENAYKTSSHIRYVHPTGTEEEQNTFQPSASIPVEMTPAVGLGPAPSIWTRSMMYQPTPPAPGSDTLRSPPSVSYGGETVYRGPDQKDLLTAL